ncbi:MAG TPA: HD-GYP domain-containing protein [Steroidobacteraceae bacterium]|nr:HD-GYP domain-containing protein [Steroidobacteraceae bacterium]
MGTQRPRRVFELRAAPAAGGALGSVPHTAPDSRRPLSPLRAPKPPKTHPGRPIPRRRVIHARLERWTRRYSCCRQVHESARSVLKKIPVNQLTVGMFVHGFEESWLKHPFWRNKFLIKDNSVLCEIQASGVRFCLIDVAQGADVAPPKPAEAAPPRADKPAEARRQRVELSDELQEAARLRERSAQAMRHMFSEARLGKAIEPGVCVSLVDDVVESINRHPDALLSLARLKTADEYTYMHSVAVCALMVSLGLQLGLDDGQCREAGMAGMLHDLGKAAMPQDVLNKPGKLTPEEYEIIKQHTVRGYEMLLGTADVSDGVKDVAHHHHERIDGTGYPDGLAGDKISLLARMGAVCDVYDAVTSDRPYKAGWDPSQALAQMATWKGHFDTAIFQSFVKSVGIYPTGSLVRMRSGRLAVVLDQNPASLTKPRVKLFFSTKAGLPLKPQIIDLAAAHATDQIEAREDPEKWNFPYLNELWDGDTALKQART